MADSSNTFKAVEIALRTSETYQVSENITVKLLDATTKWTVSGDSALSVSLELKDKNKIETVYLERTNGEVSEKNWQMININLLEGDNGYIELKISPR